MPSFAFTAASIASLLVSFPSVNANVLRRTAQTFPPCSVPYTPFKYVGCYNDPSVPRALSFSPQSYDTQNSTIEKCTAACKGNGYKYAGLEYYGECFCGDSIAGNSVDEAQCTFACTGDKTETCGGSDILSVYMDPTFPTTDPNTISDYMPQGCYAEGNYGRAVTYRQDQLVGSTLTTENCLAACKSQGYPLAGTEFGGECYCGVVLGNGTVPAPDSDCNMPCNGDSTETCGGPARLNLYIANDLMSLEPCGSLLPPPVVTSSSSSSSAAQTSTTSSSSSAASSSTTTTSQTSASGTSTSSTSTSTTSSSPTSTSTSTTSSSPTSTSTSTTSTSPTSTSTSTTSTSPTSMSTSASATSSTSQTSPSSTSTSSTSTSTSAASTSTSSTSPTSTSATTSASSTTSVSSTSQTSTSTTSTSPTSTSTSSTSSSSSTISSTTSSTTSTSPSSTSPTSTSSISTSPTSTSSTTSTSPTSTSSTTSTSPTSTSTSSKSSSITSSTTSLSSSTSSTISTTPSSTASITTTSRTTTLTTLSTSKIPTCTSASATPTSTCEYSCGQFCSKPLPTFSDKDSCKAALSHCILQIFDCYQTAGYPASQQCTKYQSWCSQVGTYCGNNCQGGQCSKGDCLSKNPPVVVSSSPPTTTSSIPVCSSSISSKTSSSTSTSSTVTVPIPTVSSVCILPNGPSGSGYEKGSCVGGITPPIVTCNNQQKDFAAGNSFKLYSGFSSSSSSDSDSDSDKCPSYGKGSVPQACKDACSTQYTACVGTYAPSCQEGYGKGKKKCQSQYDDCMQANGDVKADGRCTAFGQGWS